jgi:hypothetical protein
MPIKIPSFMSAIIYGAVFMPVFVSIFKLLNANFAGQIALFVWSVIGFFLPVLISTLDFGYIRQEMKKGRPFWGPWTKSQDFKEFYIPAWKRIFVCFIAACISLLILKLIGIDLS